MNRGPACSPRSVIERARPTSKSQGREISSGLTTLYQRVLKGHGHVSGVPIGLRWCESCLSGPDFNKTLPQNLISVRVIVLITPETDRILSITR